MSVHFIDGDDYCSGCGNCCRDVRGLLVTPEELERVPLLRPFVTHFDGVLHIIDVDGPRPYLLGDGRCGTFETRPFDCSLFPVAINQVLAMAEGELEVHWARGAAIECPYDDELFAQLDNVRFEAFERWARRAADAERVEFVRDPDRRSPAASRRHARRILKALRLHAVVRGARSAWRRFRSAH